jgi:hypothetical protein
LGLRVIDIAEEIHSFFSDFPGYKASNPVVSDDGHFMAFQMARSKDPAGMGYGIFVYDFAKVRKPH